MAQQIGSTVAPCGTPRDGRISLASRTYVDAPGNIRELPVQTCRAPGPHARETAERMHAKWLRAGWTPREDVSDEEIQRRRAAHKAASVRERPQSRAERDAALVGAAVGAALDASGRKAR